jgi:hypothetical protein
MNRLLLGLFLGLAAGIIDVLLMLPMKFPDKPTALLGALFSRFAIGFLAANVNYRFTRHWLEHWSDCSSAFQTRLSQKPMLPF